MNGNIVQAASSSTVLQAALSYSQMGISVLPCTGKKPAMQWSAFQSRIAHPIAIRKWAEVGLLQNVGVICGAVSGNLAVIDLDGEEACYAYAQHYPELLNTYAVTSGSGVGMHFYYYVNRLPPTTRVVGSPFGNIELRANGCYVVAPPSLHPSGKFYTVANRAPIRRLDTMQPIVEWIKSLMRQKHGGKMPPASNRAVKSSSAWAAAALAGECANVRHAPEGSRNATLYRAALKMGSLIADGKLQRFQVEDALLEAAALLTQSDGMNATLKTLFSGIDKGMESSRERYSKRA